MAGERQPSHVPDFFPDELPLFRIGDVVRHRRYGYRGLIVDFDMACQANEQWYLHNNTQPDRDQPWYHVLVDGSDATTYAAESSLQLAEETDPITHPLVGYFFDGMTQGHYIRNDEPWPGW